MLAKGRTYTNKAVIRFHVTGTFAENRKKILSLSAVMSCFTIFNILSQEELFLSESNIRFTLADGYVLMATLHSKDIFILPIFLLLLSAFLKNDAEIQFVTRNKNRETIWKWNCFKIAILAAYISFFETLIILGTGIVQGQKMINWTEKESIFWFDTGMMLTKEESLFHVIGMFIVTTAITCMLVGMAYLFVKELTKSTIVAYGVCLCWGIAEYYSIHKIVLNRLCMGFRYWTHKEYDWIGYTLIGMAALSLFSRKLIKRKEYL